jgi:CRP/FNR family cyclic AMP-dependent transcriptional regulator
MNLPIARKSHTPGNFWSLLDERQRAIVRSRATVRRFEPGTVIIREGDLSRWVIVLTSGRVKVAATAPGGRQAVLAMRGPGDIVGEMAAVDGTPRSATVIAVDRITALWLPFDGFLQLLREHPAISEALLKSTTARLRYANVRRTEFADRPAAARVAALLVDLAERFGVPTREGVLIGLRIGQNDIAGLVSASREAVSRALRTLRTGGVISTGRQRIVIHRLEALRRLTWQ